MKWFFINGMHINHFIIQLYYTKLISFHSSIEFRPPPLLIMSRVGVAYNFRIVETDFSGIRTEHNYRLIGHSLHII